MDSAIMLDLYYTIEGRGESVFRARSCSGVLPWFI